MRGRYRCRLRWGPHPHRSPPARIFAEQKCLAAAKTAKSAARQSDRCTNCKPVCNCNPERECFLKPQKIISLVRHCMPRTPGIAQGSADPCVFTRQRKKQLLRGGSTPRFFAQLRSVGSNYPAGRSLPESHWSLDHRSSQNLPRRPAGAKIPRFPGGTLNASHAETPDSGLRPFGYRRHDRRCSIARAGSDTKNSAFRCIRQARTHSPAGFPDRIPHSRSAG